MFAACLYSLSYLYSYPFLFVSSHCFSRFLFRFSFYYSLPSSFMFRTDVPLVFLSFFFFFLSNLSSYSIFLLSVLSYLLISPHFFLPSDQKYHPALLPFLVSLIQVNVKHTGMFRCLQCWSEYVSSFSNKTAFSKITYSSECVCGGEGGSIDCYNIDLANEKGNRHECCHLVASFSKV